MKVRQFAQAGVSLSAMLWSVAASAQGLPTEDATAEQGGGEIVVTANRKAQSLQDVAMSVNVATGEQLEKLNLFDAKDISRISPGLELSNTTGRNNTTTLRGVGFDPDQGTGPTVQTYLNEVPTSAQTIFTALYDIGQIEILRGPQGLLRGLSAPAGAITITTRRPTFDNEIGGYMQGTTTDRHAYNVQGGVTLPFSDTFAIRAAAVVDGNRLNQVYNVNRDQHSRSMTESARLTLGWQPNSDLTAYLTYQYLEADNRQIQQVIGAGNAPTAGFGDPTLSGPAIDVGDYEGVIEGDARFRNNTHLVNLNVDYDLGNARLAFVGGYQKSRLNSELDADSGNAIPNYTSPQRLKVPFNVWTGELRLSSDTSSAFGWGVGAFYQKTTGTTVSSQRADVFFAPAPVSFGLLFPVGVTTTVPVNQETWSFNGNARFRAGQFTLEGGLRYTISKAKRVAEINVMGNVIQGIPDELRDQEDKPLTGGATLTWQPSRSFTGYLSYGHSFRSGTTGVGVPAGVSTDLLVTKPEKTDSIELGVKGSLFDRKLNFSLAAFYQKFDGFISRFPVINYNCREIAGQCNPAGPPPNADPAGLPVNGVFDFNYNADATIKGIEATIDARPTTFWDLSVSASYTKARYDKDARLPCNDFNGDGVPDGLGVPRINGNGNVSFCGYSRLADVPDFNLTANTELRIPTGGDLQPFVRGLVTYRPSVFSQGTAFDLPSRTIVDMFAGLRIGERWEITGFVRNLLDQRRITRISIDQFQTTTLAGSTYQSGYRLINATNPREFGLTTAFRF